MKLKTILLTFALLATTSIAKPSRPNILFFLVDDMGWQETSVPFHTERTKLNDLKPTAPTNT
jgi:hypothetical protein